MRKNYDQLVGRALSRYPLDIKSYEYLTEETNIFYKVQCMNDIKYALKICQEESSTIEDNECEAFFLNVLAEKLDYEIPSVLRSKNGESVVTIYDEEEDLHKRIIIYHWIDGDEFENRENDERFIHLGEMTAKMHQVMMDVEIPDTIHPKKWDKVFFYRGEEPVYHKKEYAHMVDGRFKSVMDEVIPILNKSLEALYEKESIMIHGDLNSWNIRVKEDKMYLIDFEEAMLGLPIHDVAVMLYYYRYSEAFDYLEVKALFEEGYRKCLELPESGFDLDTIEMLMTARRVNFLNYVLVLGGDRHEYINKSLPKVEDYLEKVRKLL